MTLDQIKMNRSVTVHAIHGGWLMRQKLNQLGIHVGDSLLLKRSVGNQGPILVEAHGTEVAIGRGMARKIEVADHP